MGQIPRGHDTLVEDLDARYRQPLLSYVLHLVNGDRHMAEDVVQEALLQLVRASMSIQRSASY